MFLSGNEIRERLDDLIVECRDPDCVKEVSYDLRVGNEVYRSEEHLPEVLSEAQPYILIKPGQFALVKTLEKVSVPDDFVGFISIKSAYKFQGLINVSGFHVDPTFTGHLLFAVQNVGPNDIRLRYQEPAFMMMWAQLSRRYTEKPRPPGYSQIPMNLMAQLGGGSITLSELKVEMDRLNTQVKFFIGIGIGLFMAMIAVLLRMILKQ